MAGLDEGERELWDAWKRSTEGVRARINAEVAGETGLSEADVSVLTHVHDGGGGALRQHELAVAMGWHRSRLSHHLSRMQERGLVTRESVAGGVELRTTTMGRAALLRARPVHAAAVRRHLVDAVPARDRDRLLTLLRLLAD
ncbi:MarR family winged helix-turn-helix transcriptional regulator [Nocardioides lianchengensis]|uniref:DNA-binding transcriptional regulator, MarR family n=1 Tax=Nocardioides lianchengensis TaxID=1045774 RepID=A0A1G6Q7M9_9ACTN|nr:MarR family transcriptional regulator [Nocardioides lianchengensis]NYG12124.1 DNA-binding MarR family transcriptional regulator [Nocardioides lianchengensis]SDC88343.1 DNA-binding transcriptional regulator, MarR family [Nocardioides lianchengensis]